MSTNGKMPVLEIFESDLRPMQIHRAQAEERLWQWETGESDGYRTGFRALDHFIRLVSGELTLIAARPSMGKTALAMQIMHNVAKQLVNGGDDGVVAIFSAEMPGWSLAMRMASVMSGVNVHKQRMGRGTAEERSRLRAALHELDSMPIWIDDNSSPSTTQMLQQLKRLHDEIPVRAMMFDFIELAGDRARTQHERVERVAVALKGIAKTLGIPVLALSQLNREVEGRANKMPMLADLRYGGMLEQIADTVLFVMRPEYYIERGMHIADVPDADREGVAYVQIAKSRNGELGMTKLAFRKEQAKFANLELKETIGGRNV